MLRTSTKNVAQEVVSSLIPQTGGLGVLADIDRACGSGSDQRRKTNTVSNNRKPKEDNYDEGFDGSDTNNDFSGRGN